MSTLHLPVTYRLSLWSWVWGLFWWAFFIGGAIIAEQFGMTVLFLIGFFVWVFLEFRARLIVTSEGFRYVWDIFNWSSFQAFWHQVNSVELTYYSTYRSYGADPGYGNRRVLRFYLSNHNDPKNIQVGWGSFSKSDLREFIRILKIKAPQAGIDPKLLEYLR